MDKPVILFKSKSECCGCTACEAVCPRNAIAMEADAEGFLYPKINPEDCIRCFKCVDVCPIKKAVSSFYEKN